MEILQNIHKSFGKKEVLKNVTMDISPKECSLIGGVNGSGKTTLLKIITGHITKFEGTLNTQSLFVSSLIETPQFFENWTGNDNLFYFSGGEISQECKKLLREFGMENDCERKVKAFSLGMKQKLLLSLTLGRTADIYILDEPFNSLDTATCAKLLCLFNEKKNSGASIIIASHLYVKSWVYDNLYTLKDGELCLSEPICALQKYRFIFPNPEMKKQAENEIPGAYDCEDDPCALLYETDNLEISGMIKNMCDYNLLGAVEDRYYTRNTRIES